MADKPTLALGSEAPNFEAYTSAGQLDFHQWTGDSWTILFSHPGKSLAAELSEVARRVPDIEKRRVKLIGISRNWTEDSQQWDACHNKYGRAPGSFDGCVQIVSDGGAQLSTLYGMVPSGNRSPSSGGPKPFTVFVVDPNKIIRQVLTYPAAISTRLYQILRAIDDSPSPQNTHSSSKSLDDDSSVRSVASNGRIYQNADIDGTRNATSFDTVANTISSIPTPLPVHTSSSTPAVTSASYIHTASQVLDHLTDVSHVIPFVIPAVILLKVIIGVEKRARDVDIKCTDLVQRITFMVSHLPMLRNVEITDATRQVIDHMNDVLKVCASLIEAYRKQGTLARRLNLGNKDRFANCAKSLSDCTNDLMVSLQIHQTTKLEVLSKAVPVDQEDETAQAFVASHGGLQAVTTNEELVKQFASQTHLTLDEGFMEQLNDNITEVMGKNQQELERKLNETVSTSIVDSLKGLAAQMNEAEKEQTFTCVQCDKEFKESTNGEKSCSFHKADYDSWRRNHPCCGTKNPCQFGSHRAKHHCDYPYGPFFPYAYKITGYTDTVDTWAEVQDTNLESGESPLACVGQLLRWQTRGGQPSEPTMLIRVGKIWYNQPYFLNTYTSKDLEIISKVVHITHQRVIFRTSFQEDQFAMAEWVISLQGVITGVKLTAKVATSTKPFVKICPLNISSCSNSGDVVTLSEGGLRSYIPDSPYVLPETQRVGPELPYKPLRPLRTDFKTRTSANLPVILKPVSDPPLVANPEFASTERDQFIGSVSVFNKHASGSNNSISVSSIKAFYRLVGDDTYLPADSFEFIEETPLPLTIEPRQTWTMKFSVYVKRSEADIKLGIRWWNRAFIARKRPLRLKLVLTDIEDEEASLVLEYICHHFEPEKVADDDLGFFYIDDANLYTRNHVHVVKRGDGEIRVGDHDFDVKGLQKVVYKALKSGESEVDLEVGQEKNTGEPGAWEWKAWALVDLSCQRIYAFKILITRGIVGKDGFACMGYVACPDYGEVINEKKPIRYAEEKVPFPELENIVEENTTWDDTVDDLVPEVPLASATPASTSASGPIGSTQLAIPEEVTQRLASIDTNLARLATAMEQVVELLKSR
ncbi:hypothetical protein K435DRAFT_730379 [Dendrothele bispora CBS 962.96]|uniref:Uncharacterized protein n=1 Tax=Dendrothele bispora (strain CBS 962.96) TaxID=1314807 RepID=A0A4S8LG99_DENBC|nr:hypothetical protein K435DRAFT_730379 [Dendrothele bispora CBS 962.96]